MADGETTTGHLKLEFEARMVGACLVFFFGISMKVDVKWKKIGAEMGRASFSGVWRRP